jgi:hypothetical protein
VSVGDLNDEPSRICCKLALHSGPGELSRTNLRKFRCCPWVSIAVATTLQKDLHSFGRVHSPGRAARCIWRVRTATISSSPRRNGTATDYPDDVCVEKITYRLRSAGICRPRGLLRIGLAAGDRTDRAALAPEFCTRAACEG